MKKKAVYRVERSFCEKLVALLNHGTIPVMDIFHADKKTKIRIIVDYDPQIDKVEINYFEEEKGEDYEI